MPPICHRSIEFGNWKIVGGKNWNEIGKSDSVTLSELDLPCLKMQPIPDAFDHELMIACLKDIQDGKPTKVPKYDFVTNSRVKGESTVIYPSDVVLLEGILIFYHKDVREMFDMKLFVDTDADTRLARRGERPKCSFLICLSIQFEEWYTFTI